MAPMTSPSIIERSIDIQAPVSRVYKQWTRFEDFPKFMEGVLEVTRVGEDRLRWRSEVGGKVHEWDVAIVERTPDTRTAWRSDESPIESGIVNFASIYGGTRVTMQMTYDPDDLRQETGESEDHLAHRIEGNLQRFKEFIESRDPDSGFHRVEIQGGQVVHDVHPGQIIQEARADTDEAVPKTP
jgi:uncharacterized membrane protein